MKIFFNFYFAFLVFTFIGWKNLQAQSNITTTIGSFNSSTCVVGDTIVLPVTVTMASGISTSAISMAIEYDTTKLRCISSVSSLNANIATGFLSNCGSFSGLSPNPPYAAGNRRQFRAAWFNLVPVSFNGVMFNLRFVVESQGNSIVKWDLVHPGNCEYANELADVIPNCSFVDGTITCGGSTPANCGITLTSAAGTISQLLCQGSAINNIVYNTVSATGATVSGLPAGVTGTWASNTVIISGTSNVVGTFNYAVTLSGCTGGTGTSNGTITVTAPPTAGNLSGTQSICVSGTTTFVSTVTGGSWSSSAAGIATVNATTGLVSGVGAGTATITYTVQGTGGCSDATATRTVTVNPNNSSTLSDTICQGVTYLFGTLTLTNSGIYTRTLPSSNGCDSVITLVLVVINKPQAPTISVSGTVDSLFANPGNRVTWYRNGIQIGINSTGFVLITQNGQYYALRDTAVGSRICYSDTSNQLILSNVGIGELLGQDKRLKVYPVPASDIIYLEGMDEGSSLDLQVFDLSGRKIKVSLNINSMDSGNRIQMNTSELPSGLYQLFLGGNQRSTAQVLRFGILR